LPDLFSVEGKTVVVTGGTRGLGAHLSRGFVEAGARVIAVSRNVESGRRISDELRTLGECHAVAADVSTPDGQIAVVEAVREFSGSGLDVLVNNAGVTWGAPLEKFPRRGWDRVLETNLIAVFELTVALLPALRERARTGGPARVINIGSIDGTRVPEFENYSYSSSKAAVHHLTRHLAKQLASDNITVNALAPGPFLSDMTAFALEDAATTEQIIASVPLARLGTPADLVGSAIYLSSRAGGFTTGAVLPVDGGLAGV
jgi:NAD(P)-dependent dehydrogenase (short-subunit alcohol dehydrogenase family)